jgi:hypothetical protein
MTLVEKTIKALDNIRTHRTVEITMMKMSMSASEIFFLDPTLDVEKGEKYITKFAGIDVFIDPYVDEDWVQIYYKTKTSSMNTVTVREPKWK